MKNPKRPKKASLPVRQREFITILPEIAEDFHGRSREREPAKLPTKKKGRR
jgi:hypothetical protein